MGKYVVFGGKESAVRGMVDHFGSRGVFGSDIAVYYRYRKLFAKKR